MDQQHRTILAVALSMAVIFAYYTWIAPPVGPPPVEDAQEQGDAQPKAPVPAPAALSPSVAPPVPPAGQEVSTENDAVRATLSSSGAVSQWILKHYHQKDSETWVDLMDDNGQGRGLVLSLGDPQYDKHPEPFAVSRGETAEGEDQFTLTQSRPDWDVKKLITIKEKTDPHLVDITVEITNKSGGAKTIDPRLWMMRTQKVNLESDGFLSFLKSQPDYWIPMWFEDADGSLGKDNRWDKLAPLREVGGKIYWTALTDRYFLVSLMARKGGSHMNVRYGKEGGNQVYTSLSYGPMVVAPGQTVQASFSAYMGPKKRESLKALGVSMEKAVDYGWSGFIAIPLLWLLIFFQKGVGNWGLAIIALTFFVKMLLHPVNKKSMQSMKAMQKLQPKLKELQEKYKDNREQQQVEMMNLFKSHKVNPVGGCLPMLLQMPVYIALYQLLWNSIEIYQAPFFWFYRDLSAPDPYFITPVLLGIFMFLQQKLTPSPTADPAQRQIMMIMPVMFSAFMIFLPVGLVLYIMVNTIMSVVQQYMMQYDLSFVDLVKKARHRMSP